MMWSNQVHGKKQGCWYPLMCMCRSGLIPPVLVSSAQGPLGGVREASDICSCPAGEQHVLTLQNGRLRQAADQVMGEEHCCLGGWERQTKECLLGAELSLKTSVPCYVRSWVIPFHRFITLENLMGTSSFDLLSLWSPSTMQTVF